MLQSRIGIFQNGPKIHPVPVGLTDLFLPLQEVCAPYQLIYAAYPELCHVFPQLLRNKAHKVHHILRFSPEALPQLRILGRHAYRAGIQVADTHHHTAHGHQGRCGKAEFFRAQYRRDRHIPAAHQLAVRLNADLISQAVHEQGLMGFRQSQFPGKARVMDGAPGSRSRAAVIAGDQDHLGPRLCHTCSHSSHSRFRHQLYRNPRVFIGVFQIVNQLRQILDGVNIVVGRRRDQPYPRRGVPCLGDPRVHLPRRQMAALTGLCPLGHLDLNLLGTDKIPGGHPETPRGHLLDGGAPVQPVLSRRQPLQALATLAAV